MGLAVFIGVGNFTGQLVGRVFQLFWGRSRDFQEFAHHPLFDFWCWASEQSWCLWVCHLAFWCVTMSVYTEAQGLVEVNLSTILDLFGSNQFTSWPWAMSFFYTLCPAAFPPVSMVLSLHGRPQFLFAWTSPQDCLSVFTIHNSKGKVEDAISFITLFLNHIPL